METEPQYSIKITEYPTSRRAVLRLTQSEQTIAVLAQPTPDSVPLVALAPEGKMLSSGEYQAALAGLIELGNLNLKWSAEPERGAGTENG